MEHLEETRALVARACRILAAHGLIEGLLGHVSARAGDGASVIYPRQVWEQLARRHAAGA